MYRSVPTSVLTRGPHSYRGRELGYPPSEPKNRGGFYGGMRDKMPLKSSFGTSIRSENCNRRHLYFHICKCPRLMGPKRRVAQIGEPTECRDGSLLPMMLVSDRTYVLELNDL